MPSGWAPGQTEGWRPVHQPCWRGPSRLSSPRRFTRHCCSSVVRLPTRLRSARAWASFAFLAVTAPWLCKSPCCTEATPVGPSRPRPGGAMESSYVRVGEQRNAGGRVPGGKCVFGSLSRRHPRSAWSLVNSVSVGAPGHGSGVTVWYCPPRRRGALSPGKPWQMPFKQICRPRAAPRRQCAFCAQMIRGLCWPLGLGACVSW